MSMQKLKMFSSVALLMVVTLVMANCHRDQPDHATELRTIDNLSGLQSEKNSCGPNSVLASQRYANEVASFLATSTGPTTQSSSTYIEGPAELRKLAAETLIAVPQHIRQAVFGPLMYAQIVIDSAAVEEFCGSTATSQAQKRFIQETHLGAHACWHKPSGDRMKVFVKANASSINHSLVRTFAFVFIEFLVPEIHRLRSELVKNDAGLELVNQVDYIDRQKLELARQFVQELQSNRSDATITKLIDLHTAEPEGFANMVYAETVDSHHCATDTHRSFQKNYPNTYAAYLASSAEGMSLYNSFGKAWHE